MLWKMPVTIQSARLDDIEHIVEVFCDGVKSQNGFYHLFDLTEGVLNHKHKQFKNAVEDEGEVLFTWRQETGKIVGYIWRIIKRPIDTRRVGQINELVVTTPHKRKGIGRQLFQSCIEWFRSQNVQRVEVNFNVQNPEASAFWTQMGFKPFFETRYLDV